MEGTTCCSRYSFSTVCCLLAGILLPLPGDGQHLSTTPSNTMSHFRLPSTEAGHLSNQTISFTALSVDGNTTAASQLNASSSIPLEPLASTTHGSYHTTARLQNATSVTNSSADIHLLPTPTANLVETNHLSMDDAKTVSTTSWVISSTNVMATELSLSKETQTTSQPKSSMLITLEPTKRRPENMSVPDHEATTEESSNETTSAPSMTDNGGRVLTLNVSNTPTLTPNIASAAHTTHKVTPVETELPANHVQKKTSIVDGGEDLPSMPEASPVGEDPLVIAVIFIFIVTVVILALMGFLRYRQRSGQLQFRRLQDLPMDDMMEDTPLSLYSY